MVGAHDDQQPPHGDRRPRQRPAQLRDAPAPLHGGPLALLRFLRRHGMLNRKYARLVAALGVAQAALPRAAADRRDRLRRPRREAPDRARRRLRLGRWSWLGHGTKIRGHEGECEIGAKTVLGQECTISAYQHVSIGRECIVADRVMLIDFDHGVVEVERPIRLQGIYKRDVSVGNNVWIGYGACILRGVTVGDNAIIGTIDRGHEGRAGRTRSWRERPARLLRMRPTPRSLRWR